MSKHTLHRKENYLYLIFILCISVFLYIRGPVYFPDSKEYISNAAIVLPLYPLLIDLLIYIFKEHAFDIIVVIQGISVVLSIRFFIKTMNKYYSLSNWTKLFLFITLLIPAIKMSNYILTEAISYSIFLIFISYFISSLPDKKVSYFMFFQLFLLVLTRSQFQILYIFLTFSTIIQFLIYDKLYKDFILSLLLLVGVYFFSAMTILNYNELHNDQNTDVKIEGLTYVRSQLYVADKTDYIHIKEDDLRAGMKRVLEKIDSRQLSSKHLWNRSHFDLSSPHIFGIFYEEFNQKKYLDKHQGMNNLQKKIAYQLVIENIPENIKYVLRKAYDSTALTMLFILILLLGSAYGVYKTRKNIFKILFFISLFSLLNHFLIYAIARFQIRYVIYSDFVLMAVLIVFFIEVINKYNKQKSINNY